MRNFLPQSLHEWKPSDAGRTYSGREIFDYIDGAGEVYLAYQYSSVLVQRYVKTGQQEILVEVFDMGSSRSAFGVFSYTRGRGPAVPIGQEGEYRSGLLCFWRDRYCVYVRIDRENADAKEAVLAIGHWIARAIGSDGQKPDLLRYVPDGACDPASLRYFYRHEILNTHVYVADGNLFLLSDSTEAILARTTIDSGYLLLVRYPSSGLVDAARASVLTHLMPDAGAEGIIRTENNRWTACVKKGCYLITVFDAASRQNAEDAVGSITGRLP